jgi:aspartate/glutamate racemase
MIGLITGFGTRAGHLVYTKFLNSFVADHDCDWPEIMVVNVAPKFDKYATVTPDIISKLRSTASMMQDCSQVFVACNTVHLYKNEWFFDIHPSLKEGDSSCETPMSERGYV